MPLPKRKPTLLYPLKGSVTISGAALGFSVVTHEVNVLGALPGQVVTVGLSPELFHPDLMYYGYISSADTLTIVVRDLSPNVYPYNGVLSYLITPI